jgi:hypothetical protein
MRLPNQTKPVQRTSSSSAKAGVKPAIFGELGQAGCMLGCGSDRQCQRDCGQIVGAVTPFLDIFGGLL